MTNITIRIDDDVKTQLQELVTELGLDITTYFTMAAKQAIKERRIPFEVSVNTPNVDTQDAFAEVLAMKNNPSDYKGYTDIDEMMKELLG